jgi:hypothetical protein
MQNVLSSEQIEAFYHDVFVEDQVRDFLALVDSRGTAKNVTDMGGGCGFFARRLKDESLHQIKVVDMDQTSVEACHRSGIEAKRGDALNPEISGDEDIVTFNLILHHLVGKTEAETQALQKQALSVWRPHIQSVFVNEYIYESYLGNLSGRLIFEITKSPILSWFGKVLSLVMPSLKANTFGVGVRFRAGDEWLQLFLSAGYLVKSSVVESASCLSRRRSDEYDAILFAGGCP